MSILIKGMEMPTRCWDCPLNTYGYCMASDSEHSDIILSDEPIPEWCPLVPVPPHGRLIDADALMLIIQEYTEEYSDTDEKGWHNEKWCAMKETEMAINDAPTIIEAEGE